MHVSVAAPVPSPSATSLDADNKPKFTITAPPPSPEEIAAAEAKVVAEQEAKKLVMSISALAAWGLSVTDVCMPDMTVTGISISSAV